MKPIMFLAGEASGDSHAAAVIQCLRAESPKQEIFGAGGPKMQAAGMVLLADLTKHAVVGLTEAIKKYWIFRRIFFELLAAVERRRPAAVVLVDNPGFNLRFAREVKRRSPATKIIYYISPQVWAWHAGRVQQMERDVDLLLSIFPFEKVWFAQHAPKLRVEFVGHPMIEQLAATPPPPREPRLVLFLPGSRRKEISHIYPLMLRTMEFLPADVQYVAVAVNHEMADLLRHPRVQVEVGNARDWMRRATATIVASGTATLECACHGLPMVVVYHVHWITYLLGRLLVNVRWLAMPNLIAGREIVPELIQGAASPARIAAQLRPLLDEPERRAAMQRELAAVVAQLGSPGASPRVARLIGDTLRQPPNADP